MTRPRHDTVDRLITMLMLPVGEDGDERPAALADEVRRVTEEFGWLVFEDAAWFDYDTDRIAQVLAGWLDEETAAWLDSLAGSAQPAEFLAGFGQLVDQWKTGQAGAAGPAGVGAAAGAADHLGIENPNFAPDEVPGTEFYTYRNNDYFYAATADARDDQWKTLEQRYDEHRSAGHSTASGDGVLRGYPYANSVLPGTEYYRLEGTEYLYGPHETGAADEWKPYEHWQQLADQEQNEKLLIEKIDSFIALVEDRIGALG